MPPPMTNPKLRHWRWYKDDGAEPITALAGEDTKPIINDGDVIRCRYQVKEYGNAGGLLPAGIEYSPNGGTNWYSVTTSSIFKWYNGAGTDGSTIGSYKLTGSNYYGKWHESDTYQTNYSGITEFDLCFQANGASDNTDYLFRVLWYPPGPFDPPGPMPLDSGMTNPEVHVVAAATGPLLGAVILTG